jgi:GTP cyclohydrolase I
LDKKKIQAAVLSIIKAVGEDPRREGLRGTPRRVADSLEELLQGYSADAKHVLEVEFDHTSGMVVAKNIDFFSLCEHHLLPFYGVVHLGYLPGKKVVGVSKLARLVDVYSKRLQLQERMTKQIADGLYDNLKPTGVMVVVEAKHLCMMMRGVKSRGTVVTSEIRGAFQSAESREEFFSLVGDSISKNM